MGLAADPDFATNRWIYVCLSSIRGASATAPADNRVARFKVNRAYTRLKHRTGILNGIEYGRELRQFGPIHHGCRLRFGPDGNLWITVGDATIPTNPQDPTSLNGKILRVESNGAPAPGNPGGALDPHIYTFGHRNPQGIAFRPGTGQVFTAEHGPSENDEVNLLEAGANYGWDPVCPPAPAPCDDDPPGYNQEVPMTDLVKFPDAKEAVWRSGDLDTLAPSGLAFLSGSQWQGYDGALAMAMLKSHHLRVLTLSPDGLTITGQDLRLRGRKRRLRSAVLAPNGKLYLTTDQPHRSDSQRGGQIWKVKPVPR